ncbi:hypothetical protein R3P38DRAFT_3342117 [Favolaschia claudopus]|uniref:Uncharacterized protein n=1 Tax=Favolaschia claudopus TaxID=2862362 RepID=A0AAW0E4U1_9AGAR
MALSIHFFGRRQANAAPDAKAAGFLVALEDLRRRWWRTAPRSGAITSTPSFAVRRAVISASFNSSYENFFAKVSTPRERGILYIRIKILPLRGPLHQHRLLEGKFDFSASAERCFQVEVPIRIFLPAPRAESLPSAPTSRFQNSDLAFPRARTWAGGSPAHHVKFVKVREVIKIFFAARPSRHSNAKHSSFSSSSTVLWRQFKLHDPSRTSNSRNSRGNANLSFSLRTVQFRVVSKSRSVLLPDPRPRLA